MSEEASESGSPSSDASARFKAEDPDPSADVASDSKNEETKASVEKKDDNIGVTASTAPLLAAAGKISPSENASAAAAAKAASTEVFKAENDDDTPKTFPQILMEILCNDEESDTISWLPHGRSFIIYKKKKFGNTVLPKYFKATKFTSFTRKLNRWGFTRVTRGPEMGSYFHKLFLRDDPQLCLRMSSHSSNKFQEPTTLMPNPAGIPFMPYGMMPNMLPPGMTQVDVAQQNQLINQQLQQLQWQQYQLQQYQQQQQSQQHNHANGPPLAAAAPAGPPGQASQQQQQQQQQTPQYTGPIPAWGSFPAQHMMMQGMASVQMPQGSQPQQQQQQQSNPQQHTTEAPNTGNTEGSGTSQAAS